MRKLLTCSTALSLALSSFHTMPARAQTLAEDGSVIGPDGTVLCVPSADAPCDLEAITRALAEAAAAEEAQRLADEEAAAQAQAEAEAAAAEAQRLADEAAAAQAQAEAEAAAQEEAQRLAAEAAAAQAEAEAAAATDEEEAVPEAPAAEPIVEDLPEPGPAEAAAPDAPVSEEVVPEEGPAQAEPLAVEEAPVDAPETPEEGQTEAAAPDEAPVQEPTEEPVAADLQTEEVAPVESVPEETAPEEPAPEEPATDGAVSEAAPAEEGTGDAAAADEVVTEDAPAEEPVPAEAPDAPAEGDVALDVAPPPAEVVPVDVPEVPEEAAVSLETILTAPTEPVALVEGDSGATGETPADTLAVAPVAAVAAEVATDGAEGTAEPAPAVDPVAVVSEIITEDTARTSSEEFAAAPVAVSGGKKSGLSDLEKVGLLALGALVVGAIINEGKKDERKVVANTGDRVVVQQPDGTYVIYKDDDAVLRRPGVRTQTETYSDGSTRTVVQRADGTEVVTIRDASGRVLRRAVYDRNGMEVVLIDDLYPEERIEISELPKPKRERVTISTADGDAALKAELAALEAESLGRKFSLRQIREIAEIRALAATIEVDSITFDTGSSAIKATEARKLADIGRLIQELLDANPREVFLIEGHTDAVGSAASNLALSDRRAESLALALTEYFEIPPENLVVQGYGEAELKVDSQGDERANRRVVVRLITPLMRVADLR